ncbi:MAG: PspC domain-containing protein [Candidatus Cryptobacteroides sp.]
MKPVENVSIGGYVFAVENDACSIAENYLKELESFYLPKESGAEVMEGIEERMAELLIEKCGPQGVVDKAAVEYVISVLGRPEAIEEDEADDPSGAQDPASAKGESQKRKARPTAGKKLYRDTANCRVAGVCSGLGAFLNLDPFVFRILFVILTIAGCVAGFRDGGIHLLGFNLTFPFVYVVMWICMPAAKTVSQRDEMRGEKGTVDAISERIKSGAQEIGDAARNIGNDIQGSKLLRIMGVVIGAVFFLGGIMCLAVLGALALSHGAWETSFLQNMILENIPETASLFLGSLHSLPTMVSLGLIVWLPFVLVTYWGVMMMFDLKAPKWHPGLVIFTLWLIALVVFCVLTVTNIPHVIPYL